MKKNLRRRCLAMLLMLAMMVGLMPAGTLPVYAAVWSGERHDAWYTGNPASLYHEIDTPEELAGLADLVNAGNDFAGKTIALTADLALNDITNYGSWATMPPLNNWIPIGTDWTGSQNRFRGVFDGNGHTITGMYIYAVNPIEQNSALALFRSIDTSAVIQDLHLESCHVNGYINTAGICGTVYGGTIARCSVSGSVTGSGYRMGGIAGFNSGTIDRCTNQASIVGGGAVGGIAGTTNGLIVNCVNSGEVAATAAGTGQMAGGIAGNADMGNVVSNSCSTGNVSSASYAGGLVGVNDGLITNSYAAAAVQGGMERMAVCWSTSVGRVSNVWWNNLLMMGQGFVGTSSGDCAGKSTDDMKSTAFTNLLNVNRGVGALWTQVPGGYPAFLPYLPQPEIDVSGNHLSIVDGDITPSAADGSSFGAVTASSGVIDKTFVIRNTGEDALQLSDASPFIRISGDHAGDFSLIAVPAQVIAPGGDTQFKIRFDPSATGGRAATVSIASSDANENLYNFTVEGTGLPDAPVISGVTASSDDGQYGTGDLLTIAVSFTQNVVVTGTPRLMLETGDEDRAAVYQSGSGSSSLEFLYTVRAGDVSSDLDYKSVNALESNGGSITASAPDGQAAILTLPAPGAAGSLAASKALVIDGVKPVVTSVEAPAAGTYRTGNTLTFRVTFNEAVLAMNDPALTSDDPTLALDIGGTTVQARYVIGTETPVMTFAYAVVSGLTDTYGITVVSLQTNGGTITDNAGNEAVLTLHGVGSTAGVRVNPPVIDPPVVNPPVVNPPVVNPPALNSPAASPVTYAGLPEIPAGTAYTDILMMIDGSLHLLGRSMAMPRLGGAEHVVTMVDEGMLERLLAQGGAGMTVTLPVSGLFRGAPESVFGSGSRGVTGILSGQALQRMQARDALLEIRTDIASYVLPASQLPLGSIAAQLGALTGGNPSLRDIQVQVSIASATEQQTSQLGAIAARYGFQPAVSPVSFDVGCAYNGQTVPVPQFSAYVTRQVAFPEDFVPSAPMNGQNLLLTGIVLEPDGTIRHVPTRVEQIDGRHYARINSLTNSLYAVVEHAISFADVESHWAKDAVNDLGSRLILAGTKGSGAVTSGTKTSGTEQKYFAPNRNVTRGEFAVMLANALGLAKGAVSGAFTDVGEAEWCAGSVYSVADFGLMEGFVDGTFCPEREMTRAEVMVSLSRAMRLAGVADVFAADTNRASAVEKVFAGFVDGGAVAPRMAEGVAACVRAGIVEGVAEGVVEGVVYGIAEGSGSRKIAAGACATRAEAAVMVRRMLVTAGLI